ARLADISKVALARPAPSVGEAQFYPGQIALIRQQHVDADQRVAEFRDGAFRQGEMRRRAAVPATADFRRRIILVLPAIAARRSFDPYLGRVEIAPVRARLGAQGAIARMYEIGTFREFEAYLAAQAGQYEHPARLPAKPPGR